MAGIACGQEASKELLQNLATPISARWGDAPARQALERLARETKTPIWIDRRVDVRKELTLAVASRPVASVIDYMAGSLDLGAAAIDNVVYIGPADSVGALPALAKQWRRGAPSALRKRLPLEWPRLSEPRKLAAEIASSAGYSIENPEAIPHDLWPAGSTPPLAVGDQLTLLCLGFDLRWTVTDRAKKTIQLEPIFGFRPHTPEKLTPLIVGAMPPAPGTIRYTLRVADQPLGAVLKQIATQLDLELDTTVDADTLNQLSSFEVQQATLKELLDAAGDAANLDIHATDTAIVVRPRQ
jgi:hypothetical protein